MVNREIDHFSSEALSLEIFLQFQDALKCTSFGVVLVHDCGIKGCMLISSCNSTKIATNCWTTINRMMQDPNKIRYPSPKTNKKPQWDGRRATITIKSNPTPARWVTYKLNSEPHVRLPSLGIWQRDWESPGNLTLKSAGFDYRLPQDPSGLGTETPVLEETNKILCTQRPRRKEQ